MNYKEYWWKCTKDVLHSLLLYLMVIGYLVLFVGGAILLGLLGVKFVEFLIPIFGVIVASIIFVAIASGGLAVIFLYFSYRHFKKYVKDDIGVNK